MKDEVSYPKAYMYRRIVAAKLFIDQNYNEKLDLNAISNESHFSRFHFIRLFTQAFGKTPHQYLTGVRIEKAKDDLIRGISVSTVCYELGFDSLPSFSRMFKKRVGLSPQAYQSAEKEKLRAKNEQPLTFVPSCFGNQLLKSL